MARIVRPRPVSLLAALALPLAILLPLSASAGDSAAPRMAAKQSPAASPCGSRVDPPQITENKTPIILVHGINSDPKMWTGDPTHEKYVEGTKDAPERYLLNGLGEKDVAFYTFDWHDSAGKNGNTLQWVVSQRHSADDPGVQLADAIHCIAWASGRQVIIVAYSMGGLLAQYATSLHPSDVAAVFTLGTPLRGSWFADLAIVSNLAEIASADYDALMTVLKPACQLTSWAAPNVHLPDDLVTACLAFQERNDSGMAGMRAHPPGDLNWKTLPAWPPNVHVYSLGLLNRTIQLTYPRSPLYVPSGPDIGDGLSTVNSQTAAGAGSSWLCQDTRTVYLWFPCFHDQPYQQDILNYVIDHIQPLVPAAAPVVAYEPSYSHGNQAYSPEIRPSEFQIWLSPAGEPGTLMTSLSWSSWDRTQAVGTGNFQYGSTTGSIVLSRPTEAADGTHYYSELTISDGQSIQYKWSWSAKEWIKQSPAPSQPLPPTQPSTTQPSTTPSTSEAPPSKQCVFLLPNQVDCTSSNPEVTLEFDNITDTSGCMFSAQITWGDGSKQTVQVPGGPAGPSFVANHTYHQRGVFPITLIPSVLSGGCTTTNGDYKFTYA